MIIKKEFFNIECDHCGAMLAQRKGTPEWDCYHTFLRHGIFKRFENDTYDRLYQK